MQTITDRLFALQDVAYRDFQSKLLPTLDKECVIGVRTPELRRLAKELRGTAEAESFLRKLPHRYYEENNLHAFLTEQIGDFPACLAAVERFLPYIDNWATCDSLKPPVFKKRAEELLPYIERWLASPHLYTRRYAVGLLMTHFLDERFETRYPEQVAALDCGEYYVHMMVAWYFATALAKQYDAVLPFLGQRRLERKTHNAAIQKALESYRISDEHKSYLRSLKY